MKKMILGLTLLSAMAMNTHAVVGYATGNIHVLRAGLVSAAVSGVYAIKSFHTDSAKDRRVALRAGILGLILLDETGAVEFTEINGELEGTTASELEVFNSEVEEANLVMEEVSSRLTANTTVEQSAKIWKEYEEFLSPETLKVMRVVVSQ